MRLRTAWFRGASALAASAGLTVVPANAGTPSSPPFSFADVDFTPDCAPNAAFARLMTVLDGAPGASADGDPAIDEPLYNAVSGAVLRVLELRGEVSWHGLRLVAIRSYRGIESGPSNLALVFADSPERVRAVWNSRGWQLPPVGETRLIKDEGHAAIVGVDSDGQFAAVTCFVD